MLLKDKVVLITGSTTGIGRAIAYHCLDAGAKVMLHGRNKARAAKICDAFDANQIAYCLADLSEANAYKQLVGETVQKFGRIDGLVNNAAQSPRNDISNITPETFDWLVNLNLRTPLFISQSAIKAFRQQKSGGAIVMIGSINAYCGQADLLGYSITKGGLMTLTRNLSNALGKEDIRINQLNVGWTLTENESHIKENEGFPKDWESSIPKTYAPSGKLLRPDDVARHVVFWLSDQTKRVRGVVYELEQYPVIGRNLINEIPLDIFKQKK